MCNFPRHTLKDYNKGGTDMRSATMGRQAYYIVAVIKGEESFANGMKCFETQRFRLNGKEFLELLGKYVPQQIKTPSETFKHVFGIC